ncbi:LLM class flavin-dependent oxidoreductase (plasmid) [Haloferax mediterranei ATCC 33500]|uniref:LLM class flavin-dependent oxidoreductase n=1 Tax=Haloferax mediterranei (strain ATCC 33500 / DSM 1411 / JCM 8866 / NBRC 14739 / NCIMB 2177 / R-4) TaxID=523841 RepID=I3RB74_HALMT|nr:LLM class flavin-dependent oxidoreductase [Haloferax mediterranei]AFK21484.1 luciferase monooxygenase [Haloferax mediterranei ATCC 33500]AHZ24455.1 luciferase [Haloferax mediterranei ATCC 33500]ELZ97201.1 luciferase monooxygenase [Haloferax mediterranei ATCC 33500]MDX5990061.1 LLM class flavin-dependent oxidoreductase [Haloferax mediterranei ATCC 33500]QCQ76852.1 LLM class flavin-dependent oxidoreductase [Haloferax mediterranei ATCC 33500]
MKLGTGLFTCQRRPDDDRPMAELYDEMLTLGRAIDESGLDSAWVSEHHFMEDGYLSGTMPALGALAATTDHIELGTCIALAPLYDPIRLAEDTATVDLLSNGRTTLGLSIGSNPREFDAFGVPRDERVDRLADTAELLRGAWSDGPIEHESPFYEGATGANVTPKPARDVPLMFGGAAKPAVRRAARTADAWCAPSSLSIGGLKKRVDDIRNVRESEDIDGDFTVYVLQHGFVGDSKEDAWNAMKDGYLYLQRRYAEIFSGEEVSELSAERQDELKEQAIFGTPDDVVEELNRYRDALGDDIHFIFRTYHPGIGTDRMVECIQRLGEEVAPRV